ncbi:MAG: stage IV sporulation protein A, partial [Acutalibacteraceae bacterium]
MTERSIYEDISKRTNGDIYIGVVGPVRTGKSTFIKSFMDTIVLPNIKEESLKIRANDELPQSASGRTIMTTEPKFIPEEAVEISLPDKAKLSVRMIDCVGYVVPDTVGSTEEDMPRMVKTPWSDTEIPFEKAAEIGTKKVITDHSTIGLVVTTDGTIGEIPRENYIEAEERVINELKAIDKPFIILLNSAYPFGEEAKTLATEMQKKYSVPVVPVNCLELDENEIKRILAQVLFEFPIVELMVDMPPWIVSLPKEHWLRKSIYNSLKENAQTLQKLREVEETAENISSNEFIKMCNIKAVDLGKGQATMEIAIKPNLFYKVLSENTDLDICDEESLLKNVNKLSEKQKEFDKISKAYRDVLDTGYGIVMPTMDELTLSEPEIIKQSGKYGIKLRATAPSIHMM